MPRLLLKFQAAVIKEIPIEKTPIAIGRKPENDIQIDNMAVSGHHARIILQGESYMIDDLQSTNGTFVNEKKIISSALKDGDNIRIGQHILAFLFPEAATKAAAAPAAAAAVVTIPPEQHDAPEQHPIPQLKPKPEFSGTLRVLEGKSENEEYSLKAFSTYIGKSETAAIKLKGLFVPDIAAIISKKPAGYIITAVKDGFPKVNGVQLSGQIDLKDGDTVEVGGIKFIFQLQETNPG